MMKLTVRFTLALAAVVLLAACHPSANEDPAAIAQNQEIEKLRQENQELAQARAENEEVQKLRKENQDLPKLRSQYQEVGRLKKDNEQLRQQVAKLSPKAATQTNSAASSSAPNAQPAGAPPSAAATEKGKEGPEEFTLNEGDDIMIEPQFLKQLVPDIDWTKMRTGPVGVRALIEKDGFVLTNALQLHEYGITNFTIRRALPTQTPPPAAPTP
jgi:hypothetical protein